MNVLDYLLRNKRPSGSTEEGTARAILGSDAVYYHTATGVFSAAVVTIGESSTLFSCHLDTVEHGYGVNKLRIIDEPSRKIVRADKSILGADNGAGVYLLTAMIDNKIPGVYHFYAEEECGSIGSKWLVANHPELYQGLSRAIAFDRKGVSDIVVEQLGGECCSPKFGISLCDALSCDKYVYQPAIGVFTDTANMIGLIPECTNISVGYYNEHTQEEYLDLTYLGVLLGKCLTIDWEGLPIVRTPVIKQRVAGYRGGNYLDDFDWDYGKDYAKDDITKAQMVDEVIDKMVMNDVTMADLLDYIRETGYTELL